MYAVIVTGGKQYKVGKDQRLKVEMLNSEAGDKVVFDKVLMLADGEKVTIGAPYVKNATVEAEVLTHGRAKKIQIIKFKRRKHHMKHMGHRQYYTEIKITAVNKAAPKKEAAPEETAPKKEEE